MTNGIGGPHGQKRTKKASGKTSTQKTGKPSFKRKGILPAGLAKAKDA
jgi:hypothetical protein